jgi:hypothetical protein
MMIHSDIEVMAKYFQLADRNISISSQKCWEFRKILIISKMLNLNCKRI